jgi:phospholipid transport system substrate-binding protein
MMRVMKRFVQAGFIAGLLAAGSANAADAAKAVPTSVDTSGPSQLIDSSAQILLAGIDARRAEFRKDPTGLYALVESTLLPHFDTPYAAQLVLGQHWRTATAEQRKRFVDAFYKSLLYTYGDAMVDFTGDRLKVIPTKVAPTDERATVRTEIKRSNGTKVGVNYSLRKVNGEWKAWDVVIDGISYVKSYREDYGAEVQQKGLDAVITRLEAKAQSAKSAKVKST